MTREFSAPEAWRPNWYIPSCARLDCRNVYNDIGGGHGLND